MRPTNANTLSPTDLHYRRVMEKALIAKRERDLKRYNQLLNEAEVLLRHLRSGTSPASLQVPEVHAAH